MAVPLDIETKNITSDEGTAPLTISSTVEGSDETANASLPVLPFIYLFLLLLGFVCGNPIPDETHRRRRRRRRDGEKEIDPVQRRKFLSDALCTKRVVGHGESNAITLEDKETAPSQNGGLDPMAGKEEPSPVPLEPVPKEEENSSSCTICLEPYLIGQDVSWSRDMRCRHVFHHECVVEWLMKHDECPCCRAQYLPPEDTSRKSDKEGDADTSSSQASYEAEDDNLNGGSMAFIIMSGLISHARRARQRYASINAEDVNNTTNVVSVGGPILNDGAEAIDAGDDGESDSALGSSMFNGVMLQKISSGLYNPISTQSISRGQKEDEKNDIFLALEDDASAFQDLEGGLVDVELGNV